MLPAETRRGPKRSRQPSLDDAPDLAPDTAGLVEMGLGDDRLHVHPTTVTAHMREGWERV